MRVRNEEGRVASPLGLVSTWAIGFGMGLAALAISSGGADERRPSVTPPPVEAAPAPDGASEPVACREDRAAWDAALDGLTANLRLAAQVADLESALDAVRSGAVDGPSFVRAAVHSMPEEELEQVLAATAKIDAARLDEMDDVRAYAVRLADLAMEGVLAEEADPVDVGEVVFSSRQEGRRDTWRTADAFDRAEDRLYAFFDTRDWPSGGVMVRWRHVDSGEVLLLEPHRVRAGVGRGFVWYSPGGRWKAGTYQVDVYADDEALGHLASGRYAVN